MAADAKQFERNWRGRLAFEQLVQMASVIVSILDRILLAALFYRFWGAQYFEAWSVVLAFTGLMGFSHLGFVSYYQNSIAKALQRGENVKAKLFFRQSFTLLFATSFLGVFIFTMYTVYYFNFGSAEKGLELTELTAVTIMMFVATAAKIPVSNIEALYRASRQYSIYASILLSGDLLRVMLMSTVIILFEPHMLLPALAAFLAITSVQVGYILYDKSVRYPHFQYGFAVPNRTQLKNALILSSGFFLNTLTTVLLASLPVLMLNARVEESGLISIFVVTRILFGLARTLAQATSVVIGHETSRYIAASKYKDAWAPIMESSRYVSFLSGIIVGVLFCVGSEFTALWMGNSDVFQMELAFVAALPALVMPAASIANNVLMTANKAYEAAAARVAQLLLFVIIYLVLPDMNPALAMFLALAFSEIFGFAILAKYFCCRVLNSHNMKFVYEDTLIAVMTASGIILANWIVHEVLLG